MHAMERLYMQEAILNMRTPSTFPDSTRCFLNIRDMIDAHGKGHRHGAALGRGRLATTWRFIMSPRSINIPWLRFDASSLLPSQFVACFVISPPATMNA